jgi:predicted permease
MGAQIGDSGVMIEGRANTPGLGAKGDWQVVSDGALEALGERLLRGRSFEASDNEQAQVVGLINETMARTYWPDVDPIGRRFRAGGDQRPWITVVGIVRDVKHNGIRARVKEKFYRSHAQFHLTSNFAPRNMTLLVRTSGPEVALASPIRAAVRELDPALPVAAIRPMSDVIDAALATPRLAGGLLALFAALALALSAVGIYGVLSYLVSQRSQEIGIRMAIGADRGQVLRHVLSGGLRLSLAGIALGSLASLLLGRFAASLLHEVKPHDPATFAAVPLLLGVVALLASYLPALRATRVDPLKALRAE